MKTFKPVNLFIAIYFIVIGFIMISCSKGSSAAPEPKPVDPVVPVVLSKPLQELVKPGFLIGALPGNSVKATEIARKEFNTIQPTCYAHWGGWPSRYVHDISGITDLANWAAPLHKKVMAHYIIGWSTPDWLTSGKWTAAELETMIDERMLNLVAPLKDKVHIWNVVNESLAKNYSGFTGGFVTGKGGFRADEECVWNRMGWEADASGLTGAYNKVNDSIPVYIRKAFEYARKYTNAELELRDFGFEFSTTYIRGLAFYQLVKHLINKKRHWMPSDYKPTLPELTLLMKLNTIGINSGKTLRNIRI